MADGNIQAAHTKLKKAVERLTAPRLGVYHDRTLTAPSLYEQLCSDLAGTQGDNKTPAKSLPPLWIDAVELKKEIDTQIRTWKKLPNNTDTPSRLNAIAQQTWRPQDTNHITTIANQIEHWADAIINLIDPESIKHISAPCPSCGRTTIYRQDKAGDTVRQPALKIVTNIGCTCQHCQAHWTPDRYLFLCRLLGFDLPEGVLE